MSRLSNFINEAISQALECFLDIEQDILDAHFDRPLLDCIPRRQEMDRLIEMAKGRIYCAREAVEIQAAGFQVVNELLERFIQVLDDYYFI